MKYINIKTKTNINNKKQFHNLIQEFHTLDIPYLPYINKYNFGYMIDYKDILAYHIEDNNSIYEYIYNETESYVYISVDSDHNDYKNLYRSMIDTHICHIPLLSKDTIFNKEIIKPIIYIHHKYNHIFKDEYNDLCDIVYNDKDIEDELLNTYNIDNNCIILPNKEIITINKQSKETLIQYKERILYKIYSYISKIIYEYPYNMNKLYKQVLNEIYNYYDNDKELNEYNYKLNDLEKRINELEKEINDLKNTKYIKEAIVTELEERLYNKDTYPLLYKGYEKEYYLDEQRDMILSIIETELQSEKDEHLVSVYKHILEENPINTVRNRLPSDASQLYRSELLYLIRRIYTYKTTERIIEMLVRDCGFEEEPGNHHNVFFFGDDRYKIPIASTPGDINFAKQMIRMTKRVCF